MSGMQLRDQVCSLELAQKLKEFGINQSSLFYFIKNKKPIHDYDGREIKREFGVIYIHELDDEIKTNINDYEVYSAFTVAELGEILPKSISLNEEDEEKKIFSNFRLVMGRSLIVEEEIPFDFWSANYICDSTNEFRNWLFDKLLAKPAYDKNEANSRAKILIYLLENGLIKND